MTPDQISMAASLLSLLKVIGGWPIGMIALALIVSIVIVPWAVIVSISRGLERRAATHDLRTVELVNEIKDVFTEAIDEQQKRFDAMAQMYQDNVLLVKGYEKLASDLANIIHLNTQTNTKLVEKINNNHYCPVVRQKSGSNSNG
jgi:hypothetical protein